MSAQLAPVARVDLILTWERSRNKGIDAPRTLMQVGGGLWGSSIAIPGYARRNTKF
jgi:hypothetical protein